MKNYEEMWKELKEFIIYKTEYYKNMYNNKMINCIMKKSAIDTRIIILNTILAEIENLESEK